MQQRRLRLGDILDDYCPRERRITNHAVVAMIEDEVRQTRCTTCDADHEYKQARVPISRRKKPEDVLPAAGEASQAAPARASVAPPRDEVDADLPVEAPFTDDAVIPADEEQADSEASADDDGPVHRPLIRATLPRPEGQMPERKAPDFTFRQSSGRFDQGRNGGRQHGRPGQSQGSSGGPQHSRSSGGGFGRGAGSSQGQRSGNRPGGNVAGGRGGRPSGPNRGERPGGGGQGRKRGR
jgi:hypothetical protein